MNIELYVWAVSGIQRMAVIKAMSKPMPPSLIRKEALRYNPKVSLNNTCDVLRGMRHMGLAVCLKPEAKLGRIYELTPAGKEVREELLKE